MNDNPKVDSQHTDYDLYASLMLYNLLDSEEVTATNEPIIEEKSIEDINNDVIWYVEYYIELSFMLKLTKTKGSC